MSGQDEVDRTIYKKFELQSKLGKGVRTCKPVDVTVLLCLVPGPPNPGLAC